MLGAIVITLKHDVYAKNRGDFIKSVSDCRNRTTLLYRESMVGGLRNNDFEFSIEICYVTIAPLKCRVVDKEDDFALLQFIIESKWLWPITKVFIKGDVVTVEIVWRSLTLSSTNLNIITIWFYQKIRKDFTQEITNFTYAHRCDQDCGNFWYTEINPQTCTTF